MTAFLRLKTTLPFVCAIILVVSTVYSGCAPSAESPDRRVKAYPDNPYVQWRSTVELSSTVPSQSHPEASDCMDREGDVALLACAEDQFWRVIQHDVEDRESQWKSMTDLESALSDTVEPVAKARFLFQRAQLAMAYVLEQTDFSMASLADMSDEQLNLLASMSNDMQDAIELDPSEPFYVTWLDTLKIATADRLRQKDNVSAAVNEAFLNVEKSTSHTTRSTLIASLTGTTAGLSLESGAPERTIELLETFECHPNVLMKNPDAMCGAGADRRDCLSWCLSNSKKAPYGGPGLMYHIGEAYARVGDKTEAQRLYELALTLPGANTWPYRSVVEEALGDMNAHIQTFTGLADDETASFVVYANSRYACSFCHAN